ncbi:MAG: hypothetical protein ACI9MR_001286 [Myxococcota bacterium]|jgi:hypothetical protein
MTDTLDWRAQLRGDVLRFALEDGGVELYDLIRTRLTTLSPSAVERLDRADATALAGLTSQGLMEGPDAEALRRATWLERRSERQRVDATWDDAGLSGVDWEQASELPAMVAAPWRDPERWRRLAQARAAGRRYLMLPGFLTPEAVDMITAEVRLLPYQRLETALLQADRCLLGAGMVEQWRAFLVDPVVRTLFGTVLSRALPAATTANAWRLKSGDFFGPHPDGRRYHGTISLGLCREWRARDGGAIAFGTPRDDRFEVAERWLPHAGDLCVFAPDGDTWHVVEQVEAPERLSVTAWWTNPEHAL